MSVNLSGRLLAERKQDERPPCAGHDSADSVVTFLAAAGADGLPGLVGRMLRQSLGTITVEAPCRGLYEITSEVAGWVSSQQIGSGLLTLFCRHTSASLLIQENAAPAARRDLEAWFERAAPEDPSLYTHHDEGPDDMPAHIRSALTQTQLSIPMEGGRMMLGTWQGIFLFEHRKGPRPRRIELHLLGDGE